MGQRPAKIKAPLHPDLGFETLLWSQGVTRVAGLDEAGRGAWAGPVAAAAVILPANNYMLERLSGVRDSKQMTARQREAWAGVIQSLAVSWGVGFAAADEVDALGIVPATRLAMERALTVCNCPAEHLLLDAMRLPGVKLPQQAVIKGDARSLSIAAASVLAKTARDAWMRDLESEFPGYGFARHKGYGTAVHRLALQELGPCAVHRFSYAPVKVFSFTTKKPLT